MKKGSLPVGWIRWRRRRYQALIAQGLARHLAWPVARAEAKARHRLSRIIANEAARKASLECVEFDGRLGFVLTGNIADLSDEQVAAIGQLNCRQKEAA